MSLIARTVRAAPTRVLTTKIINNLLAPTYALRGGFMTANRFLNSGKLKDCHSKADAGCYKLNCGSIPTKPGCEKEVKKDSKKSTKSKDCVYDDPVCCDNPCPNPAPRLDCLYYKPSDKKTRKYQQTWVSCPKRNIKPKLLCEYPFVEKAPPLPVRSKNVPKPKTACSLLSSDGGMQCPVKDGKSACIKIKLPGCKAVRNPPKCKQLRGPSKCKKVKCPYPSFSECNKPKVKPKHPTECDCLTVRSMCDVFTIAKAKGLKF